MIPGELLCIPIDVEVPELAEGFHATFEQWAIPGMPNSGVVHMNLFQWSGKNLFFVRAFGGESPARCLMEFGAWLDAMDEVFDF